MRLSCQKAFIPVIVLTLACGDSTAPPSLAPSAYSLETIGGRPLPAHIQASEGDTITVVASTLIFDGAGNATFTEHIRYVHPNSPPGEATYTVGYKYHIERGVIGNYLAFEYSPLCPPNALCAEPPTGMIVGTQLILSFGNPTYRPQSFYRLGVRID
jgi:hypothetical protein